MVISVVQAELIKIHFGNTFTVLDAFVPIKGQKCPTPKYCISVKVMSSSIKYDLASRSIPRVIEIHCRVIILQTDIINTII